MDDGSTGVLAERENSLSCRFGVAQELQSHILVVFRSLRVAEDLGHLQVVLSAEHELHVVERLLCQGCERLFCHLQDFLSFELSYRHTLFGEQIVFSIVLAHLEHRSILEIWFCCHNVLFL